MLTKKQILKMGNSFVLIFREEVEREENERGVRLSEFALLKLLYHCLALLLAVNLFVFVIGLLDSLDSDDDDDDHHHLAWGFPFIFLSFSHSLIHSFLGSDVFFPFIVEGCSGGECSMASLDREFLVHFHGGCYSVEEEKDNVGHSCR